MRGSIYSRELQLLWIDQMKAIALIWVFLAHVIMYLYGDNYLNNPSIAWPSLEERLAHLRPLSGYGLWTVPLNIFRYISLCGEQGVSLFIILSGFGLTWGLLERHQDQNLDIRKFYYRRLKRILPLWWAAHLFFVVTFVCFRWGMSPKDPLFYLSFLGIRFTQETFFYFCSAWWFVGLLLQLYLVYPLLWWGLQRLGPLKLLLICCIVAFPIRAYGLLHFGAYLDEWNRGAIFITRLPEFVVGISLATWMSRDSKRFDNYLRSRGAIVLAAIFYLIGFSFSFFLLGVTLSKFILGTSAFLLFYVLLGGTYASRPRVHALRWLGSHSYSLYLIFPAMMSLILPFGDSSLAFIPRIFLVLSLTGLIAPSLERIVSKVEPRVEVWLKRKKLFHS